MTVPALSPRSATLIAIGERITPVILTYNEAPNIGRTLERLTWAKRVVVLDSLSTDETKPICKKFPNVDWFERPFDCHANQWNYAIQGTGIETEWTLALDADYLLSDALIAEMSSSLDDEGTSAWRCGFEYFVFGRPLRASLYPPVVTLFRTRVGRYVQDGHTQRLYVEGAIRNLRSVISHDDRKPLSQWITSQVKYAALEADLLLAAAPEALNRVDRLRRMGWLAPLVVFLYVFIFRGCFLDGCAGWYYTLQRVVAESLLALTIIDRRLRDGRE